MPPTQSQRLVLAAALLAPAGCTPDLKSMTTWELLRHTTQHEGERSWEASSLAFARAQENPAVVRNLTKLLSDAAKPRIPWNLIGAVLTQLEAQEQSAVWADDLRKCLAGKRWSSNSPASCRTIDQVQRHALEWRPSLLP